MSSEKISLNRYIKNDSNSICSKLCKVCQEKDDCMGTCFNHVYDVFTICISLIDLVTDVLVMMQYYNDNKMTFFTLSAIILTIAQLSYCFVFAVKNAYHSNGVRRLCKIFFIFLCCIPFSPIMSFVFYFTSSKDTCLTHFLENYYCISLRFEDNTVSENVSPLRKWMRKKITKHLGCFLFCLFFFASLLFFATGPAKKLVVFFNV